VVAVPRDLAQNSCLRITLHSTEGDMLSAPAHLAHWVKRNRESGADLAARLSPAGFLDDQPRGAAGSALGLRPSRGHVGAAWVS